MKIALLQSHIYWESKKENQEIFLQILKELKKEGIAAIFLPEMSFTGFSMNIALTQEEEKETVIFLKEASKEYGITIGAGWVQKCGKKAKNHYSIVDHGIEILDYAKIHPFSYSGEDDYFEGGDSLSVCKVGDFQTGALICYDLRFPEVFQILSKKCDLILVPANWPARRREHWMTLLSARAIENQCYIAGINCVGEIGELSYSGDSRVINPNGEVLKPLKVLENQGCDVLIYQIENDVESYRKNFPTKKDRKEMLYHKISSTI